MRECFDRDSLLELEELSYTCVSMLRGYVSTYPFYMYIVSGVKSKRCVIFVTAPI
jgi:hypothetical protein